MKAESRMASEKELLEQAKQFIVEKKYAEARRLLLSMPTNTTAQKWLVKLDEIAPAPSPKKEPVSLPEPEPIATTPPLQRAAATLPDIDVPPAVPAIKKLTPRPTPSPSSQPPADFESAQVDMLRPRKPKRELGLEAESSEDRGRFEQVKELFSQAQTLLHNMPGNRRAAKWSVRLENIDKPYPGERFFDAGEDATPQERIMHFINETKSSQTRSDLQNFVNSDTFRYVMGGTAIVMAALMLLSFFLFSWMEIGTFGANESLTAMQIWLGTNDEVPTLDIGVEADEAGFGDIRLIDRLLIFILPLAVVMIAVGVLYIQKRLPTKTALIALVSLAFVLMIFGFFWRTLSTSNWKGGLEETSRGFGGDDFVESTLETLKAGYSTGEQELYAFLVFAVTGTGLVLLIADERGMLEPDFE